MKLSELKPCACCNGLLIKPPAHFWYCVRVSQVMLNPKATRQTMGLMQILGGGMDPWTVKVAETLSPDADCVMVLGDKEPALMTEAHICFECMTGGRFDGLLGLMEKKPDDPDGSAGDAVAPATSPGGNSEERQLDQWEAEGGAPSSAAEAHHHFDRDAFAATGRDTGGDLQSPAVRGGNLLDLSVFE